MFAKEVIVWGGDEARAEFKREREKRINAKRQEQERIEQERSARLNAFKDALPYSDEAAQELCEKVSAGGLLTVICREDHLPSIRRCNQWLKERSEFQQLMDMAKNDRLGIFEEEVIEIADDLKRDFKTVIKNGREQRIADPEVIARAKLRIEVRFRHLKSGKPAKWGDVTTLNIKGDDPLNFGNLSVSELERRLAEFEVKNSIVKPA